MKRSLSSTLSGMPGCDQMRMVSDGRRGSGSLHRRTWSATPQKDQDLVGLFLTATRTAFLGKIPGKCPTKLPQGSCA